VKLDIKRRGPRKVNKITFTAEAGVESDLTFLHDLAYAIEHECLRGGPSHAAYALARAWHKSLDDVELDDEPAAAPQDGVTKDA
jgi:hypothetical protein